MNSSLSMVEAKLPPGFRFHPRDDELICDYLMKKVACCDSLSLLMDVDLNNCEPWDIPANTCVGGKDWYFYNKRDRKYATGLRLNRATKFGYWKATGKDRPIHHGATLVGMRKTLVFYQGRAPKGTKTNWVMHEFRLEGPLYPPKIAFTKEDWVLCRVFLKNKEGTAKQCTESTCNDKNSSSLPPLMDSYISTFDKTQPNANQQVPCFSYFLPTFSHITHMDPNTLPKSSPTFGPTCLSPFSNEKGVLKAVLDQLTKMEGIISSESCLFNVGDLSAVWDPCY